MRSFFSVPSVFRSLIAVLLGGLLMHSGSGGATVPTDRAVEPLTATIVACGDIVPHYEVVTDARTGDGFDFTRWFGPEVIREISGADYAFCTLESAVRPGIDLRYYPQFNTAEELLRDLKAVGFDMICLASNHCADMLFDGIVDTIDACERQGLDHTGTYRTWEERESDRGILFRDINGIRFAILDYTTITNQYTLPDHEWAVSSFYEDYWSLDPQINRYDEIAADIRMAREKADIVLAVCHWGMEFHLEPVEHQHRWADFLLKNGVDIIIGSHPHVPEPAESRLITQPDGTQRRAYIFYSLGNFFSGMINPAGDITPCVRMSFEKDPESGRTEIVSVDYSPLYRAILPYGADRAYQIWDMDRAIAAWDAGESGGREMTDYMYGMTVSCREQLLDIVGTELYAGRVNDG